MPVSTLSLDPATLRHGRARRRAFALVITLLILSLLIIVAVSYLTSMSGERLTSNAYTAKSRAEQVAQAGVDSAMAILTESFRDFPDSATAWDARQSQNNGSSTNPLVVSSDYNEGTTLYLRAAPTTAQVNGSSATVADPQPNAATALASDPAGNNPNNPKARNFVLPLISGVPGGRAQLVTSKATMLPTMNLGEADPTKQNYVDLNVRRYGPNPGSSDPIVKQYGDIWGVIGSPPEWTGTPAMIPTSVIGPTGGTGHGPKPARAYWVNLAGGDGRLTGRYAFWIEDESFRANLNYDNNPATRTDNGADVSTHRFPLAPSALQPYINGIADASLSGVLTNNFDANISTDAASILNTRQVFPDGFLTDPLAFAHSIESTSGGATFSNAVLDAFHYLTTNQSGALNLTRHGTQRLSLNTTVTDVDRSGNAGAATKAIQRQIDQLVKTLQFHLPNFSQRFYRTSANTDSTTLNATQVVYNSSLSGQKIGDPTQIYLYKTAANLRDFIDSSNQPTLVQSLLTVYPVGVPPLQPYGGDTDPEPNPMWAVGKTAAPFLQETAVRFRPVTPQSAGKGTYRLSVDYYLEFWNMSDRDITVADLNSPQIHISDQQSWVSYPSKVQLTVTDPSKPPPQDGKNDFTIDLTGGGPEVGGGVYLGGVLQDGTNGTSKGVVFRAGSATVITTDPDYQGYAFSTPYYDNTGKKNTTLYTSLSGVPNPKTTYYCPIIPPGTRNYAGPINAVTGGTDYGIWPLFRDGTQDYGTEVTFFNRFGYLDCALYSLAEGGSPISTYTDTSTSPGYYNDYSYGGSLFGNSTTSEMGDPRTNNEQLIFHRNSGAGSGDFSRYYNGNHTLGYQNANYVQPVGGSGSSFSGTGASSSSTFVPWPDYFTWPATNTDYVDLNAPVAPAVFAGKPLASIGQLGDVYDPARISPTPETARGGGRTYKIGQRDDRITYDPTGNPNSNNTLSNVPASLGWASWRLADVFSAGPVNPAAPYGPVQEPIEQPGRININGVNRDNGAALRTLLMGFNFQPATVDARSGSVSEPLFHTPANLATLPLQTQPTDLTGNLNPVGIAQLVAQISARLKAQPTASNVPWGPFFERGELGELAANNVAFFGQNVTSTFLTSKLLATNVDMNRTFDHGREELFRRLAEMICTRGDTFTVYAVGQSLAQGTKTSPVKITGTHRMRVTFRLVPRQLTPTGVYKDFNPAYQLNTDGTIQSGVDFTPTTASEVNLRFAKPDRYDVQILEANVL